MTGLQRSLVVYVWDNEAPQVVELHRAVLTRAEYDSERCGFDGYFLLDDVAAFSDSLKGRYGNERYAIRDWLARDPADFFATRYGWNKEEYLKAFPGSQLNAGEVPRAAFFKAESRWPIWGVESESWILGQKSGFPQDRGAFKIAVRDELKRAFLLQEADMRARGLDPSDETQQRNYLEGLQRAGKPTFTVMGDVCMSWNKMTLISRSDARDCLKAALERYAESVTMLELPRKEEGWLRHLPGKIQKIAVIAGDPLVEHCRFRLRTDEGVLAEHIVGTHSDNVRRALGRSVMAND